MRRLLVFVVATMLAFDGSTYAQTAGRGSNLLTQVRTIPLDGVQGRSITLAWTSSVSGCSSPLSETTLWRWST
jgi:hypothetical protein